MKVSLSRASGRAPGWMDDAWRRRVARAAAGVGRRGATVNLVVVGDREMRRLNRRYRGKDKPTDVLSFGYDAGPGDDVVGDVFVSYQTLARDARRLGVEARHLAVRIVVHGLLHVVGYDHESDAEAARMERRERSVLKRVLPARVVRELF
ncbi:MAG TPA: rRNA maturation RNase YbeY [Candidatus Krumholzibacteria bacterium]|nr:rRNA maturation RNase YbeY [Candidatus Krumholzibacteria bacterium]